MTITESVIEALLPVLNTMNSELKNLNELFTNLSQTVDDLNVGVSTINETINDLNKTVEDHKSQISSELTDLHTSIDNPPTDVLARAVLFLIVPYLNRIDMNIDDSTNSLSEDFENDISGLNGRLTEIEAKLTDSVINLGETMTETMEEYKNQTTYELAELHTSLQTSINNSPTDVIGNTILGKLQPYFTNISERIDISTISLTEDLCSPK